jgi:hypothetical protein
MRAGVIQLTTEQQNLRNCTLLAAEELIIQLGKKVQVCIGICCDTLNITYSQQVLAANKLEHRMPVLGRYQQVRQQAARVATVGEPCHTCKDDMYPSNLRYHQL